MPPPAHVHGRRSTAMATRIRASSVLLRVSSLSRQAAAAPSSARSLASSLAGLQCWRGNSKTAPLLCHLSRYPPLLTRASFSTKSAEDDDKTALEAKAEVEQVSDETRKDQWGNRGKLIYEGSLAHPVRGLKRVSITTCLVSILAVPALVMYGKESVPVAGQVAVMSAALVGTGSSTLLLNLCVSPYVFRMAEIYEGGVAQGEDGDVRKKPRNKKNRYGMPKLSGRRFRVERMNIFGVRRTTEFSIDEVEPMPNTSRPFVSFKAAGSYYFIQGHDMADKVLLQTLLGRELKDHEKRTPNSAT